MDQIRPPTLVFFKNLFGALPKIGDWIQKYVHIWHGFKFSKKAIQIILALKNTEEFIFEINVKNVTEEEDEEEEHSLGLGF